MNGKRELKEEIISEVEEIMEKRFKVKNRIIERNNYGRETRRKIQKDKLVMDGYTIYRTDGDGE